MPFDCAIPPRAGYCPSRPRVHKDRTHVAEKVVRGLRRPGRGNDRLVSLLLLGVIVLGWLYYGNNDVSWIRCFLSTSGGLDEVLV